MDKEEFRRQIQSFDLDPNMPVEQRVERQNELLRQLWERVDRLEQEVDTHAKFFDFD